MRLRRRARAAGEAGRRKRGGSDDAVVGGLLEDVGAPPDHPLEANVGLNRSGGRPTSSITTPAELDVGVQVATRLSRPARRPPSARPRWRSRPWRRRCAAPHPAGTRSGVGGLVDPVAEAHDLVAPGDRADQVGAGRCRAPMASSRSSARDGAPPCSGPDSAAMAPATAPATSAPVEVMTREVKVEALKPWSMVRIWYCSTARALSASGRSPVSIHR